MANFYMTLPAEELARQVAMLLNEHNKLRKHHTVNTIISSKASYFVDVVSGAVIGCSAILRENDQITRQFHLCVHQNFRRLGVARKLKMAALRYVSTPYTYVTIREDNIASINLNISAGFVPVKKDWVGDHHVLTLGRMMTNDRQQTSEVVSDTRRPDSKSDVLNSKSTNILFYTGT